VGIILINQQVANDIRHVLKSYSATIPTVLEIPSKEHPYDPEQDTIMLRVNMFLGGGL
jgi:V-type H+-transporting ATPase subunit F